MRVVKATVLFAMLFGTRKEVSPAQPACNERLDTSAYRHLAPLLAASQDYARASGCRFRGSDFPDALDQADAPSGSGDGATTSHEMTPVVSEFAKRLRAGDSELAEEVDRAFRLVMMESVRNAMIGAVQMLDMWPPKSLKSEVDRDDCSFEDVSASLPEIAQRLFNDEERRRQFSPHFEHRAMTAAFVVDFAAEVGVQLPQLPDTQAMMLREFAARLQEWEQCAKSTAGVEIGSVSRSAQRAGDAFIFCLGVGPAADRLRGEVFAYSTACLGAAAGLFTPVLAAGVVLTGRAVLGAYTVQALGIDHPFVAARRFASEL